MSIELDVRQAFISSGDAGAPQAAAPPGISLSTGIASVSSEYYWGTATVTYSIAVTGSPWGGYSAGSAYDEPFKPEYSAFSIQQAAQFRLAIGKWNELIATSFAETSGAANTGDIRIAFSNVGANAAAYAYFPPYHGSASGSLYQGDIWFAHTSTASSMAPGSFDFQTLLHELGHSLGLNHSFEGTIPLTASLDNYRYSIMSYTNITDSNVVTFSGTPSSISGAFSSANFITPSLYDIAAVQQRYGADTATRAGATTYTWSAASTTLEVIYDAGGIDTWDLSAQTRASDIDLREGAYSSINRFTRAEQIAAAVATYGESNRSFIESYFAVIAANALYEWRDNVGIAFGTVIENVIGGSGNDTIAGNSVNNSLAGGNGADSLSGLAGDDTLAGGAGNDTATGGTGNDTFVYLSGLDTITDFTAGGTDDKIDLTAFTALTSLTAVLSLAVQSGANTVITLGAGNVLTLSNVTRTALTAADFQLATVAANIINGTAAGDLLTGTDGADSILGNDGNDTLSGGNGSDTLSGGNGEDVITYDSADTPANITGGAGTDTLVVTGGALPTTFNLAAQSFEKAIQQETDSTVGISWSSRSTIFDASWQTVSQSGVVDNGDTWQSYFTSNVLTTYIATDSGPNDQVYTSYTNSYTTGGAQISTVGTYDDGRTWNTSFDYTNTNPWASLTTTFNGATATLQNGSYDIGDTWVSTYHPGGQLATFIYYDTAANDQPYANYTNSYNAAGQQLSTVGTYDDGRTWNTSMDYNNSQAWTSLTTTFSGATATLQNGTYDNGDTWVSTYHPNGNIATFTYYDTGANDQPYNYYIISYNTAGTAVSNQGQYDNGTTWFFNI
jgi:Ca2+-binding RTX toxin-like protein